MRAVLMGLPLAAAIACSSCRDEPVPVDSSKDPGHDGTGGGAAASGGTGGGADAAPDAALDAPEDVYGSQLDAGVLTDAAIWTPVGDDRGCGLYVARADPDLLPHLTWQACGTGCEVAELAGPAPFLGVLSSGTTAYESDGEIFVRTSHGSPLMYMPLVSRLSDGKTIAAIEVRNNACAIGSWPTNSALWFTVRDPSFTHLRLGQVSTAPGAAVRWSRWYDEDRTTQTAVGTEDLYALSLSGGTIIGGAVTDPHPTTIYEGAVTYQMGAHNSLVVWRGYDGTDFLQGYSRAAGMRTMWRPSAGFGVLGVATSDRYVTWMVVEALDPNEYKFKSAKLYWAPFTNSPDPAAATVSVALPATKLFYRLATGGDYAVSQGCNDVDGSVLECALYVVKLSTGKYWKIRQRPGKNLLAQLIAVSDTYVFVGEDDVGTNIASVQRYLRFRIDQLDAVQNLW